MPKSILNNGLEALFSCNLLRFGYYVTNKTKRTYGQNKAGFIMQHLQKPKDQSLTLEQHWAIIPATSSTARKKS